MTTTTMINRIQMLLEEGILDEEDARKLELAERAKNPNIWRNIGSVVTEVWLKKFITQDKDMLLLKDDLRKYAGVDDPVLIQGETGTGKELLAHALHGGRAGEFRAVNVTNLPSELLESELFGHVRGAFTGAVNDKPGLFQAAHNGTIFLDEIGDMPIDMQAKLLRALDEKKARRLGSNEEYEFNARVVCATNQNIWEKKFRADLYHRISVLTLYTKPMRERLNDVALIVESLCKNFPKDFVWHNSNVDHLQGNVRSIKKYVRRWEITGRIT